MRAYLEDEQCVAYKFEQDLMIPNNFTIDCGCNVRSDPDYYRSLREKRQEWGEDAGEVDEKLARSELGAGEAAAK